MGDIQSLCEVLPFGFESEDSLLDGVYIMHLGEKNSSQGGGEGRSYRRAPHHRRYV